MPRGVDSWPQKKKGIVGVGLALGTRMPVLRQSLPAFEPSVVVVVVVVVVRVPWYSARLFHRGDCCTSCRGDCFFPGLSVYEKEQSYYYDYS